MLEAGDDRAAVGSEGANQEAGNRHAESREQEESQPVTDGADGGNPGATGTTETGRGGRSTTDGARVQGRAEQSAVEDRFASRETGREHAAAHGLSPTDTPHVPRDDVSRPDGKLPGVSGCTATPGRHDSGVQTDTTVTTVRSTARASFFRLAHERTQRR